MPYGTITTGSGGPAQWTGTYYYRERSGSNSLLDPFTHVFRFRDNSLQLIIRKGDALPQRRSVVIGGQDTVDYIKRPCDLPSLPAGIQSNLVARASIQARSDLFSKGQVLAGVMIAESRKTVDMITHRVLQITTALKYCKRRMFRSALRSLQYNGKKYNRRKRWKSTWQENWLEMRYGWMPLIGECQTYIDRVCKGTGWGTLIGKGYAQWEDVVEKVDHSQGSVVRTSITASARSRGRGTISHGALNELNASGLANIASTAYELVPYSFVLDWFLPVGDWVSSLNPPPGFVALGGANSWKIFRSVFSNWSAKTIKSGPYTTTLWPVTNYRHDLVVQRNPGNPSGVLLPPWNLSLSTNRCIDAIALLSQQFFDRSRK